MKLYRVAIMINKAETIFLYMIFSFKITCTFILNMECFIKK